jgi:hypothetical protein
MSLTQSSTSLTCQAPFHHLKDPRHPRIHFLLYKLLRLLLSMGVVLIYLVLLVGRRMAQENALTMIVEIMMGQTVLIINLKVI